MSQLSTRDFDIGQEFVGVVDVHYLTPTPEPGWTELPAGHILWLKNFPDRGMWLEGCNTELESGELVVLRVIGIAQDDLDEDDDGIQWPARIVELAEE